jgi:hypothetical protein
MPSYLRDLEQRFGNIDNIAHLADGLNTVLDGLCMIDPSRVQDIADLVDLTLGPLLVHRPSVFGDGHKGREQAEGNDSLLVHDIELVRDGRD